MDGFQRLTDVSKLWGGVEIAGEFLVLYPESPPHVAGRGYRITVLRAGKYNLTFTQYVHIRADGTCVACAKPRQVTHYPGLFLLRGGRFSSATVLRPSLQLFDGYVEAHRRYGWFPHWALFNLAVRETEELEATKQAIDA